MKRRRNKTPKRFPIFDHHVPKTLRNRSNLRRGRDRHQYILHIRTRANYQDLRKRILDGIKFDTSSTLYVMCTGDAVPNDYVLTLLNEYGDMVEIMDKWVTKDGVTSWAGTVVVYIRENDAKFAAKDIPMRCRYIKAIPLCDILPILVDFELMHTWSDHYSSTVLISARRSLNTDDATTLIYDVADYGKIQRLFLNNTVFSTNVICEVTYPFLAQAYLAMMMTGGRLFGNVKLSSRLADDRRNNGILEDAKECIMERMVSVFQ